MRVIKNWCQQTPSLRCPRGFFKCPRVPISPDFCIQWSIFILTAEGWFLPGRTSEESGVCEILHVKESHAFVNHQLGFSPCVLGKGELGLRSPAPPCVGTIERAKKCYGNILADYCSNNNSYDNFFGKLILAIQGFYEDIHEGYH